jgi:hypothetical protein
MFLIMPFWDFIKIQTNIVNKLIKIKRILLDFLNIYASCIIVWKLPCRNDEFSYIQQLIFGFKSPIVNSRVEII